MKTKLFILSLIVLISVFGCENSTQISTNDVQDSTQTIKSILKVGQVIVATNELEDPSFSKTVILIVQVKDGTIAGLILNRRTTNKVGDLVEEWANNSLLISNGGPVGEDGLVHLHTLGNKLPNSANIMDGLSFMGDLSSIENELIQNKLSKKDIRFFRGYSVWKTDQFDKEYSDWKSWKIIDSISIADIMDDDSNLWNKLGN